MPAQIAVRTAPSQAATDLATALARATTLWLPLVPPASTRALVAVTPARRPARPALPRGIQTPLAPLRRISTPRYMPKVTWLSAKWTYVIFSDNKRRIFVHYRSFLGIFSFFYCSLMKNKLSTRLLRRRSVLRAAKTLAYPVVMVHHISSYQRWRISCINRFIKTAAIALKGPTRVRRTSLKRSLDIVLVTGPETIKKRKIQFGLDATSCWK